MNCTPKWGLAYYLTSTKKDVGSASWRDLIDDSEQWWDYRHSKLDGLVNIKFPGFKLELWLSSAPQWVSSHLEGLKFVVKIQKTKAVEKASKDELWKDFVEDPGKWWDNRLHKLKENIQDFKHKELVKRFGSVGHRPGCFLRCRLQNVSKLPLSASGIRCCLEPY